MYNIILYIMTDFVIKGHGGDHFKSISEMAAHLGGVKLFQAAKTSKITSFFLPNRNSGSAKRTGHSARNFWPRRNLSKIFFSYCFVFNHPPPIPITLTVSLFLLTLRSLSIPFL